MHTYPTFPLESFNLRLSNQVGRATWKDSAVIGLNPKMKSTGLEGIVKPPFYGV